MKLETKTINIKILLKYITVFFFFFLTNHSLFAKLFGVCQSKKYIRKLNNLSNLTKGCSFSFVISSILVCLASCFFILCFNSYF